MPGNATTYNKFWKPDYDDNGPVEYSLFCAALDSTDVDIRALEISGAALSSLVTGWAVMENQDILIPDCSYNAADTFVVTGADRTAYFTAGKYIRAQLDDGTYKGSTVVSSSFAAGDTTVIINDSILTNPIGGIWLTATRDGLFPSGPGYINARDYGVPGTTAWDAANAAAGILERAIILCPGAWGRPTSDPLSNITTIAMPGAEIDPGATDLTLAKFVAFGDGIYRVFFPTGAGAVYPMGIKEVLPEWWGATNDGVACDAAIQAANRVAITSPFPPLAFQAGYYRYTSPIAIPSTAPVTIRGAGEFSTYLYQCNGASTDGAIYVLGGIYAIGGLGVGGSSELFWPEGTPKTTLKDFTVLSNTGPALRLKNCSGIQISNVCPYRGGTGYPIMDVNGTSQSQFHDMWIGHSNLGPTPYTFPDTVTALYSLRIISDGITNPRTECTELDWTNIRVGSGLVNGGSAVFIQNADAAIYGIQINFVNLNGKGTPNVKVLTVDSANVWLTNGYLENTSGTADTVEVLTTYGNSLLSMNNVQLPGVIKATESGGHTINLKLHQTRYPRLNCVTALDTLKVTSCEFAQDPYTTSPLYIASTHLVWKGNNYSNWQPYTPAAIVGWNPAPSHSCYYRRDGQEVEVNLLISGTSDSATTTCSLPYPVISGNYYIVAPVRLKDNGTVQATPGMAYAIAGGTIITFYKDWNNAAFTASGDKQVTVGFKYLTNP